jgi:glycosyltransferase involved in cell wall biosynthesis
VHTVTIQPSRAAAHAVQPRHRVHGTCFWYGSVNVARAAASCQYRIGNFVELMSGAEVVIAPTLPSSVYVGMRAVCCIRPLVTPSVARTLNALRKHGVELVADFDDLLFAGQVAGLPGSVGGSRSAEEVSRRLAGYRAALSAFDVLTVSTRALAARASALAVAPVHVVPTGLSARWVEQGRALYRAWQPGDARLIRYFAGSPSHDQDLASIAQPLNRFLVDHPDVQLELVGPVVIDQQAFPPGQVRSVRSIPYADLPPLLSSTWVNLMPLRETEFNECSKFLEASAFHCPTIGSPNGDLARHQQLGGPVIECWSHHDWYDALQSLLVDERRMKLGRAAAEYVLRHGMASSAVEAWNLATGRKST